MATTFYYRRGRRPHAPPMPFGPDPAADAGDTWKESRPPRPDGHPPYDRLEAILRGLLYAVGACGALWMFLHYLAKA